MVNKFGKGLRLATYQMLWAWDKHILQRGCDTIPSKGTLVVLSLIHMLNKGLIKDCYKSATVLTLEVKSKKRRSQGHLFLEVTN